jgi:hypothetical protein
MTFVHVAPTQDEGWNKQAAVRASETTRVTEVVNRLLDDLAHLGSASRPRLDYLEPAAVDSIRDDPETYELIGRAAGSLEAAGERCVTTAYWPERDGAAVDVELELSGDEVVWGPGMVPLVGAAASHRLRATVDPAAGRVERLELG